MPDFISNSTFIINDSENGAGDFRWTNDGHLQVPLKWIVQLVGLDDNDQIFVVDVNEALDSNRELKENYVKDEVEIEIALDVNQTIVTTQTFDLYYRYQVNVTPDYVDYLEVNVALANSTDFCTEQSKLEYRTLFVRQDDLSESQKTLRSEEGKVFNETIYSTDEGVLWDGKLKNGEEAKYVLFTESDEFEELTYYQVFKPKPELDFDPSQGISYSFGSQPASCPKRPEVTAVQLFISPNLLNTDRTREAICDGVTTTQPNLSQRTQITAYVQGGGDSIAGKTLFQEDGINPIDPRVFAVSSPFGLTQASIIRLVGKNQPYYLLQFVDNISNGKNGARVAQNSIDSCSIQNTEPTDCEKLDNNIPPTNNETIICREVEYSWNGFAWNPTTRPIGGSGENGDGNGDGIITSETGDNIGDTTGGRLDGRFGGL
jgi:hypothetical protein